MTAFLGNIAAFSPIPHTRGSLRLLQRIIIQRDPLSLVRCCHLLRNTHQLLTLPT